MRALALTVTPPRDIVVTPADTTGDFPVPPLVVSLGATAIVLALIAVVKSRSFW